MNEAGVIPFFHGSWTKVPRGAGVWPKIHDLIYVNAPTSFVLEEIVVFLKL
jgi:hypothetical protein